MIRTKHCVSLLESQHTQGGNDCAGTGSSELRLLSPAGTIPMAGRRDKTDSFPETPFVVLHDDHESPGHRGDIGCSTTPRKLYLGIVWIANVRRIEIAVPVNLCTADESQVDTTALQVGHDLPQSSRPRSLCHVWSIAHRVQQLRGGPITHQTRLKHADGVRSMCP